MTPTHAYLGVWNGVCECIVTDIFPRITADKLSEIVMGGGTVHRVTLEQARDAFLQPWPKKEES